MDPLTATRDHFTPRAALAGESGRWVPCCAACNRLKGSILPRAWLAFVDHNPGYWRTFRGHYEIARWLIDHNAWRRSQGWRSLSLYSLAPERLMVSINRL